MPMEGDFSNNALSPAEIARLAVETSASGVIAKSGPSKGQSLSATTYQSGSDGTGGPEGAQGTPTYTSSYESSNPDGTRNQYDSSGNFVKTYKPSDGIGSFFEGLGKAIEALAPIGIAIFAPELLPAIGTSLGATGAAATALGGAVVSGGAALAGGKSGEDVLKNAALGAAGGYAGSEAVKAAGATGTAGSALGGAVSGGTQAALTGKDVGEAALKGGLSSGLTSGIRQGLDVLNPPTARELQELSLQGKSQTSKNMSLDPYRSPSQQFFDSLSPNAETISEGYSYANPYFAPMQTDLSQSALDATGQTSKPDSTNKELAGILSKGLTTNLFGKPSGSTGGTSPAKSTTIGEAVGASPMAFGAADVLGVDTTPGEIGSKKRAGTEEYPWGEPTGTSALKQGLGI